MKKNDVKDLLEKLNPFKSGSAIEEEEEYPAAPKHLAEFEKNVNQYERDLKDPDKTKWPSDIDLALTKKFIYSYQPTSPKTYVLRGDLLTKIDLLIEELEKKSSEQLISSPEKSPPPSFGHTVKMSKRMKHNLDSKNAPPSSPKTSSHE